MTELGTSPRSGTTRLMCGWISRIDLALELDAVTRLKDGIRLCLEAADVGTREILEKILAEEEEGIEWLEAQLHLVEEVGKENYLAEMMRE